MKISIAEVNHIAKLSKLKFTEEEAEKFAVEFEKILEYFHSMGKVSLDDVDLHKIEGEPTWDHRADESTEFEDKEELFRNVKSMKDTYIQVPKIIE